MVLDFYRLLHLSFIKRKTLKVVSKIPIGSQNETTKRKPSKTKTLYQAILAFVILMSSKIIMFCLLGLISLSVFGQSIKIDLSENVNDSIIRKVQHGKEFDISIVNKLPNAEYNITITRRFIPIEKLKIEATDMSSASLLVDEKCTELRAKIKNLLDTENEEDLPGILKSISKEIKDTTGDGCTQIDIDGARKIFNMTTLKELWEGSLNQGEQLEVLVSRTDGGVTKKWIYIFSTEPRGEWHVSYGFSFLIYGFYKENVFFSSLLDSTYVIKKESNRKFMDFAPSIFFSWMPTKSLNSSWNVGLTGGLGFDFENPTVFLGPTIAYNQNLRINLGIVAHRQRVLLGKYEEGQIINENLTTDQLHEQLYRINPFISISFRFNQSPFNRQD